MNNSSQVEMNFLSLDDLVSENHAYRKFLILIDFEQLCLPLISKYSCLGRGGYSVATGIKALILQWMEDLSDRQLERYLQENLAAKLFCDFLISDKTPDHSYFGKLRDRIGTEGIGDIFNQIGSALSEAGYVSECFTFVDSTALITKGALWKERDEAIANKEEKLNNGNVSKYAADDQARYGCKGKNKHWFGYKNHCAVDMKCGFITKTAATPANVNDANGLQHVCPNQGAVVADKGYCTKPAQDILKAKNCYDMTIKNRNMKNKNREKDKFISKIRSPYENIFSKMNRRVRYRSIAKVQYQCFMEAIAFNLKRLVKIAAPPLKIA